MAFKKLLRKLHLILGLSSGVVVFIVAVSGCLYCFEKEIRQVTHRNLYEVPEPGTYRESLSSVVELAKKAHADPKIKNVVYPAEINKSVQVHFKDKTVVFVDPCAGQVLGSLDMETEFFAVVLNLHRSLLLGETGKMITGISALIFLIMIISGIIMWWPHSRYALKNAITFKKGSTKKRINLDLHRVLGFYASFVLIFSVLTGLIWSFKWAEGTMYWLSGSKKEQQKIKSISPAGKKIEVDLISEAVHLRFPGKDISISYPEDKEGSYRVNVVESEDGFFKKQHQLFFDQYSGATLKEKLYSQASAGDRIKAANYNIHTGKVFGLIGQFIVFFASAIAASLPITGFMIWYSRQKKNRKVPNVAVTMPVSHLAQQ